MTDPKDWPSDCSNWSSPHDRPRRLSRLHAKHNSRAYSAVDERQHRIREICVNLRNMIYLLNTPVLTGYGQWQFNGPIPAEEARARLTGQAVQSAIGHAATAELLGKLLARPVPVNRVAVTLQPGDSALVFRLTQRLPEGRILNAAELVTIPHEFGWLYYQNSEQQGN